MNKIYIRRFYHILANELRRFIVNSKRENSTLLEFYTFYLRICLLGFPLF